MQIIIRYIIIALFFGMGVFIQLVGEELQKPLIESVGFMMFFLPVNFIFGIVANIIEKR